MTIGDYVTLAGTATVSALVGHFWKRLLRIQRPQINGAEKTLMEMMHKIQVTQIRHGAKLEDIGNRLVAVEEWVNIFRERRDEGV